METVREESQGSEAAEVEEQVNAAASDEARRDGEPVAESSDKSHKSISNKSNSNKIDDEPTSTTSRTQSQPPPPPEAPPVGPATITSGAAALGAPESQEPETTVAPAESTTMTENEKREQQQDSQEEEQHREQEAVKIVEARTNLSTLTQMEYYLSLQIERCKFYQSYYDAQGNPTVASKFETYSELTTRDLDLLRKVIQVGGEAPKYRFDEMQMVCVPTNVDVKEKELQVSVKTSGLQIPQGSTTYIVAEFEFPVTKSETHGEMLGRWLHTIKIEPKRLICCASMAEKQLDMIYSTDEQPFHRPDKSLTHYDQPLKFFVDKGRSRTLKRKYKPIKLTFYEKTSFVNFDKRLGTIQVRVDAINEESTIVTRLPIMDGRKETGGLADITIRVREPLVEKALKTHREKFLILT